MTAAAPAALPRRAGLPLLALGEVAFALVALAAVVGFRRVFIGGDWFGPLLLHVVLAHGTVTALRRARVPAGPAMLGAGVAGWLALSWIHVGHLTTYGVPTTVTVDGLGTAVSDAFAQFADVKAPTEPLDGFVIAAAIGVWLTAVIGDWAAFRVGAALEATLPSATLFGIAAVLGADQDRIAVTGVWIAAVLAFVLLRRADRLGTTATWVGDATGRGPRALVLLGCGLAVTATLVAALIGPRLPGAESEAVVSLTDIGDGGPGTRVTVSPLVDIRSRLVNQADVEVFTVRSEVRSYWRLTSLDRFDGRIWSSNGSYGKSSGDLDDGVPVASEQIVFEQDVQVAALAQIWLPAAYEPQSVQVSEPVRYDEVSGTLIVDTEVPTSDGTSYRVTSALPQHRADLLSTASNAAPAELAERYLDLPADFPPAVRELATQITSGAGSGYEAALRLQNFFRDNFVYDLDIGPGHSANAIESFLFELRRGYCEQFAGSFAAMARSIGIPARVAVGFTPGIPDPNDPTLFRVRGEHAHAWPEVFLGEYGWVAFEPTPGRGAPFAEQYTGVPEQQVQSDGDPTTATTALTPPSTAPVPADPSQTIPTSVPDFEGPGGADPDADADDSALAPWFGRLAWASGALVVVVALYLATVLAVTGWRRSRRRAEARTNVAQVALAWDEALAVLRRIGVPTSGAETQRQAAARIARQVPSVEDQIRQLASSVETASFAPGGAEPDAGHRALALADRIDATITASMPATDRFVDRFHPRRLRD